MERKYVIKGMSCAACANHVYQAVNNIDGCKDVNVNLFTNILRVNADDNISDAIIIKAVKKAGYECLLPEIKNNNKTSNIKLTKLVISVILLFILLYISMGSMFNIVPSILDNKLILGLVEFIILIPIIILNFNYFTSGFSKLFRFKPNMDSLVAIGSFISIVYSLYSLYKVFMGNNDYYKQYYFESAGTILTFVSVGKYIESKSKAKTTSSIDELMKLKESKIIKVENRNEILVNVDDLKIDDLIKVNSGQVIPTDGIVQSGSFLVNESSITGESIPINKLVGEEVLSGSIVTSGFAYIKVKKESKDSTLSNIINLVNEASSSKTYSSRIADKLSGLFTPILILISIIVFIIWMIISKNVGTSLNYAISVLVISCPCALGLAVPICIMISSGIAAKNNIIIKEGKSIEDLANIKTVVFDKTGTLTNNNLIVESYVKKDDRFIDYLCSIESYSNHPIAKSITQYFKKYKKVEIDHINEYYGGLIAFINGNKFFAGNNSFIKQNLDVDINYGSNCIILASNDLILGYITLVDKLNESSKFTVSLFKYDKIKTILLTGDNKSKSEIIASKLKIDKTYSEVKPEDKALIINKLKVKNKVLMIGDGINDSIALNLADVSISIFEGSDVAKNSSDIILMKNDILDSYNAFKLAKMTTKKIKMNLFWAFIYNFIAIPIAAGALSFINIKLNPMISSICMSASSIFVCLNALSLNKFKKEKIEYEKIIIKVDGMMCKNCKKHVEEAILKIENVKSCNASLDSKKVIIEYNDSIDLDKIKIDLLEQGYTVIS